MKLIESSIRFPVSTAVAVILLVLFGVLALTRIPVQLTPNVEEPVITVTTVWPGASPAEVEREIVDEQEEQLKSLEGMLKMESSSADSMGTISITFPAGTDLDNAVLRVSNRLEQVPQYPADADKPIISSVDVNENAIAWFILTRAEGGSFEGSIATLYDFVDDFVKPELERVEGVAGSNIFGGREREMQVLVDPVKLAAREITLNQLAEALDRENRNYSGGDFSEGKRRYVVRTVGEYESASDIENLVVTVRNGIPVYLRDVARAELGFQKPAARVYGFGEEIIALNAIRRTGANTLDVMAGLRLAVDGLNRELLEPRGLVLRQVYDETEYISSAISLVQQSLAVGGVLAILVLLIYLRSFTSTLIVAVAIPISVVGTFMTMLWFGRTLNVVSLAGLAFAVGMVVDNSIVVLENIYRHRQMGKRRFQAALDGARQVWGAVLASTLTTVAVFLPVPFIEAEVGQLFGDIAIAISCAVALSLLISITVIPSLSAKILGGSGGKKARGWGLGRIGGAFQRGVTGSVAWINRSVVRRVAVVLLLPVLSLGLGWLLLPDTEYLPIGNQNFIIGLVLPPPGYNVDEVAELRRPFDRALRPLWTSAPGSAEAQSQPGGGLENFFFVALADRAFTGFKVRDPLRVRELIPTLQDLSGELPGTLVVITQSSIFQRGIDEGRNIDIELTGPDLDQLLALGRDVFFQIGEQFPSGQARPIPSLDLGNPEIRVITQRKRAAELGVSNRELAFAVSALVDGAKASDFQYEGKEIDLRVGVDESVARRTHLLADLPLASPRGGLVTLGSVAEIEQASGPTQINHRERQRVITIRFTPDETTALESAMNTIREDILGPLEREGRLGGLYQAWLSGSADKLTETGREIQWNLLLALVITYLLMAALFESFLYPFVIMFSVPLAGLGGILGLAVLNQFTYQPLDVLTMLGFVILVGTVVNNAILIVHQSLNHIREDGAPIQEAITRSVSNRIRPIFMSVSTSVFGMLPLVLFPGAGSELYRGLGSVVVGGLVVSTVFTLFLVPALLSLTLQAREAIAAVLRRSPLAEEA